MADFGSISSCQKFLNPDSHATPFIIDAGNSSKQPRRASASNFKEKLSSMKQVLKKQLISIIPQPHQRIILISVVKQEPNKRFLPYRVLRSSSSIPSGERHFTLGVNALETFVMAGIKEGEELEYSKF